MTIKKIEQVTTDYAKIHEEQDVRRTIFVEMSKRSSTFTKNKKGDVIKTEPGIWSDFDFDFSRAPIFYPLNNLTIEQGQFSSARFYGKANFRNAEFTGNANFRHAEFTGNADFRHAGFIGDAHFVGAKFTRDAGFIYAEFTGSADFWGAKFAGTARFLNTKFAGTARFLKTKFTGTARFKYAKFAGNARFTDAKFAENADFGGAEFTGNAGFLLAKFTGITSFDSAYFEKSAPTFADTSDSAQFSALMDPEDYNFSVRSGSKPIPRGEAELDGIERQIPVGTVLFDPDSGRTSDPAKPIKESDNQGETPSK